MIVIADSGTTKTTWQFVDKDGFNQRFNTIGFNPYYQDTDSVYSNIVSGLIPNMDLSRPLTHIYFYGAGCEQLDKREQIAIALRKAFPKTDVWVNHDLLAAARALFGDEPGLACISGTGSNTCMYDGNDITRNVHSLGLFLGDEGSGGYKGKLLIQAYIREYLPAHLRVKFEEDYTDRTAEILDSVYIKDFPSRYLASYVPFLVKNISDPFIKNLVKQSFKDMFDNSIVRYANYKEVPLGFIGSVGYYNREILEDVAHSYGATISKIIRSPMDALAEYHLSK
jgi:N-acetylglucosamine kinase-like BadF-type ATPase